MASPRKKFANRISSVRKSGGQLTKFQRSGIIQDVLRGDKIGDVARRYSCHRNTIRNTINRYHETNNLSNRPKSGRQPVLNRRERRSLIRQIQKDPSVPWATLLEWVQSSLGKKVSKDTLRRAIRTTHLRHWKSLKRIYLSRKAVLERSRFYREWRGKEEEAT